MINEISKEISKSEETDNMEYETFQTLIQRINGTFLRSDHIKFTLHNEEHTVKVGDVPAETTLLEYLRDYEHLKGTKFMCLEGGCGCCIVSVTAEHPITKRITTFAVNSCLVSIYSCQGWKIQTVDGIGSKRTGYHPIQKVLAENNGTQCGFCSPGWVMNMYALYESSDKLTMKQVEDSFGGNMCRCTGYRPILTAFKTLAQDADKEILGEYPDIEDIDSCERRDCQNTCKSVCRKRYPSILSLKLTDSKWFKVNSINEIFDVFRANLLSSYQLVAGNTARGVYPNFNRNTDIYIDITSVINLRNDALTPNSFVVGANKPLTETIAVFETTASTNGFAYLKSLAEHIKLVAHVPVRNIGTLAGNLSIKHKHNEFPSDIFLIFETVGAKLTIATSKTTEEQLDLVRYLSYAMRRKVMKTITFPKLDNSYKYQSYKITPREQNSHAMVNAGFLLKLENEQTVREARIVYGGINPSFVHATKAEKYIVGKQIFDNNTLQGVFKALDEDIQPDNNLPETSPEFRKKLAIALFYKFILSITPANKLTSKNKTGGQLLSRPISRGTQENQTNKSMYPITQPIIKIEALGQTSGEVEYITDMPDIQDQLYAKFVVAKAPANSILKNIDPSKALKREGVVSFYSAKDIPGQNNFIPTSANYPPGFVPPTVKLVPEELFCSSTVKYYFQPIGIIVAKTQQIAEEAADLVTVTYDPGKNKPLLTIRQILEAGATDRITEEVSRKATRKGTDIKYVVKGKHDTSWQYHYHMETQVCRVIPKDDGLDVYPGTQWMDLTQVAIANVLNIKANSINIFVKRIGGAYGAKITRNTLISCATAVAAHKLQKPVMMHLSFVDNMNIIGKRFPASADYEVGLNDKGEIQYLNCTLYLDYGAGGNEPIVNFAFDVFSSSYTHDTWTVIGNNTKSDNHPSVWTRAPGHTNIMAMIESIMEHIAMEMNKPPLDIRLANITQDKNNKILQFINECRQWSDYDNRLNTVQNFNKDNRWRKKGLSLIPMTFGFVYAGTHTSTVSIYAGDGSVAVSHSGVEIGQGINTKVAQACAYALKIDLSMVAIKGSVNFLSPNNFATGGSLTSEAVCYATLSACETLLSRMKPIRDKMGNPSWVDLVRECQKQNVTLIATHMWSTNDPPKPYNIYGVCVAEVEVDILTGLYQINRVDLLEDTGDSLSPLIDIGQVEGAFIMGLGYWRTERTVYNKNGRLLTNRTWDYKIPGALDIPIDFRVKFPENNPNPNGVLHSKATAEPPLCLASSIPLAIRQAVSSARNDADSTAKKWYPFDGPSSVENTFLNSLHDYKQYTL